MKKPVEFSKYTDNQVILTSDRLVFNTRKDSLFLISNKTIGLSANESIHFNIGDGKSSKGLFVLNSNKIQLGLQGKGSQLESVAKADSLEVILNDLLNSLSAFSSKLSTATGTGSGVIGLISINAAANALAYQVKTIKTKVKNIKSKTSYTI